MELETPLDVTLRGSQRTRRRGRNLQLPPLLDTKRNKMYIHTIMSARLPDGDRANGLFPLTCACQNLRRLTRLVTRIYDQELRKADIEITQFGLLTALDIVS